MAANKDITLAPARDPFGVLRQITSEFDRVFRDRGWSGLGPALTPPVFGTHGYFPEIDVFEKDGRLVTKVDLPGLKKEDVKVEIGDGHLVISGERKSHVEERKENFYRSERAYGSFYRAVPLPDGARLEDVAATFVDGVLEVSVPLAAKERPAARRVEIQGATTPTKAA